MIARLDTYDKVQRRLVVLDVPEGTEPGETLNSGRRTAGWVTSVSTMNEQRPFGCARICRRAFIEPGTVLGASSGEANVVETRRPSAVRTGAEAIYLCRRVSPPSTTSTWPRIISASSLHRNETVLATSSAVTVRPAGVGRLPVPSRPVRPEMR